MKKIIIIIVVLILLGGAIWTWRYYFEEAEIKWREYILEEITQDFQSPDFMDRRLIGIREDGQRDIIIESIKDLMGWEKLPGEAGHYPRKVSFPRFSNKIFFVKHLAGTGHSEGLFALDINSLEFRELIGVGSIYENYYNYLSIVSPDGFKIASLGRDRLYLLDLLRDEIEVLAEKEAGTVFYVAQEVPDFIWLDDYTIQFPIFSAERIYDPPIELRQLSIKVRDIEKPIEEETAGLPFEALATEDWQIYRNEEYGFEIKYPENFVIDETDNSTTFKLSEEEHYGPVWIKIFNNPKGYTVEEFYNFYASPGNLEIAFKETGRGVYFNPYELSREVKEMEVGGIIATHFLSVTMGDGVVPISFVSITHRNVLLAISTYPIDDEAVRLHEQMLSTFRFIEIEQPKTTEDLLNILSANRSDWTSPVTTLASGLDWASTITSINIEEKIIETQGINQKIRTSFLPETIFEDKQSNILSLDDLKEGDFVLFSGIYQMAGKMTAEWEVIIVADKIKLLGKCIREGEEKNTDIGCCPGLTLIEQKYCTKCGDGICKPPENKDNCPLDCTEVGEFLSVGIFIDTKSFDLENKTFEGETSVEGKDVKIITTDSTEFYRTAAPDWQKEYFTFTGFYSLLENWIGPLWPFTVKGIREKENIIKADEVFMVIQ